MSRKVGTAALNLVKTAAGATLTSILGVLNTISTAVAAILVDTTSLESTVDSSQEAGRTVQINRPPYIPIQKAWDDLTTVGTTVPVACGDAVHHGVRYTVDNVDTSVTVIIEGSYDGETFWPLDTATLTADDDYPFDYFGTLHSIRVNMSAEVGGTNVTITPVYYGVGG